jgi:Ni,Fe-hydrogenase III large subunit/Ni,Fe-hydrogenase III component G
MESLSTSSEFENLYSYLKRFSDRLVEEEDNLRIVVESEKLREVAEVLSKTEGVFLRTIAASDERSVNGFYKMYYVFGIDKIHRNIVIEVPVDPSDPVVPSITDIVKAADWYEKEVHDLMGIKFSGRTLYKFVLPDDWPDNVYPLRKDYTVQDLVKLYRPEIVTKAKEVEAEAAIIIPIGPYHPALHEPEYFELYVRGEKVVDARYVGFMVHRGIEKLAESMKYDQVPFLAERICGICGFVHSCSYCQAVEKALKIPVPERAEYIRSIVLEIERIHSHLLWLGVAFHLLGYDTGFMHIWRIREQVMILAELLTGSRKTYGLNIIGGVRRDIDRDKAKKCLQVLDNIEKEFKNFVDAAINVPQIKSRLRRTGLLPKSEATSLSLVGPTVRGSGIPRDIRKDYPYAAYKYIDFKPVVRSECDNMARTEVRIYEIFQSIELVKNFLDRIPEGDIAVDSWEPEPYKFGIGAVEAPRGEVIHIVITGRYSPYRWRARAPTYQNLPAIPIMLRDIELADAPITIASIDPCFSCTDRALIIDISSNNVKSVPLNILSLKSSKLFR